MLTQSTLTSVLTDLEPVIKAKHAGDLASSGISQRFGIDDLFQVTCMKAHQSLETLRSTDPKNVRAWILAIANNSLITAINSNRCKKRDVRLEAGDSPVPKAAALEPCEAMELLESFDALNHSLAKLPERQAKAIRMRYLDSAEYAEIALALDTSRDNARNLVARGLRNLRS